MTPRPTQPTRTPPIAAAAMALAAVLVATTAHTTAMAQPRAPIAPPATGPAKPAAAAPADPNAEKIIAVVNGDVITTGDVAARARLFALSTGLPVTPDVLERLRPQVVKQLIDERLRLQEAQRRKIAVTDNEIAEAIGEIEQRNGLPAGRLMAQLKGQGVALRTLIDQVRVQIGWTRVLRQELGDKTNVSDADIAEANREFQLQVGKPEYQIAEIFIPIDDPAKAADAQKFAETVINELHQGAPFGVVAAQFSQSQTALQGGDLGWVSPQQLDTAVANVVAEMPVGAISNPTRVPGGIDIVTLRAKRDIGRERSTVVHLRQVFLPFQGQLNPQAPTAQQRGAVDQAQAISKAVHSCSDMEEANRKAGATRPADPGEVRLEGVGSPPLRALLASTPVGQPTKPIVSSEGVAILMICSREDKVAAAPSKAETTSRLVEQRAELISRQLQRDLRRRAVLDERGNT